MACIFLILAVLLQSGKGGDASGAFGGGGSQSAFGPRGPQKPLEKATAILAAICRMQHIGLLTFSSDLALTIAQGRQR